MVGWPAALRHLGGSARRHVIIVLMGESVLRDGTRLHHEVRGTGRPSIVCGGGPSTTYDYLVDDLNPLTTDMSLIFHDYRGSGRSSSAPIDTYTFGQLADDIAELASDLGHSSVDVIAHSLGVSVALSCALRHPELVRRLVLIDGSPSGVMRRMALPTLQSLGLLRTFKVMGRALTYAIVWRGRPESEDRTLARFSIMGTMQEGAAEFRDEVRRREVLADNDNAPHLERHAASFDVVKQLDAIEQPTLVIYGTRDAPFAAAARLLTDHLPNAKELRVEGSGHHPLVEEHDSVITAIREFLTRA